MGYRMIFILKNGDLVTVEKIARINMFSNAIEYVTLKNEREIIYNPEIDYDSIVIRRDD